MNDLTLLYYSSNTLDDHAATYCRDHLTTDYPIVSVTQKPVKLGKNICVGDIGKSYYNCYKQIYLGLQQVKTKYVAMIEDDSLYPPEHFEYRPKTIGYNKSMWFLESNKQGAYFWHKWQTGMFACIASTKVLLEILKRRFDEYQTEPLPRNKQWLRWREPGQTPYFDRPKTPINYFSTTTPIITLNYYGGLEGKKKSDSHPPAVSDSLPYWGSAVDLKAAVWAR